MDGGSEGYALGGAEPVFYISMHPIHSYIRSSCAVGD